MLRAVLRLAEERGWRSEAVFGRTARERSWMADLESDGIPVHVVQGNTRVARWRFVKKLLSEAPDEPTVLHTHFTTFDLPAVVAARGHRQSDVFWHLHTTSKRTFGIRVRNRLKFSLFGPRVAGILCVAPHIAELVGRWSPPGRVSFVLNGIDVDAFRPATPDERRAARDELGLEAGPPLLTHFGWDWEVKGGDVFLDTVALLVQRGLDLRAVTRTLDPRAARAIERRGLESTVRVVPHVERIQSLYASADMLVAPSRAEGMPFAAFEALCSGLPVVASDIPGHAAIADALPGCRIVPPRPEALADAVAELLERPPELAAEQAAQARDRVRATMSLERWASDLLDRYEEALALQRNAQAALGRMS
jgi:glycosyltransferase involved in cell wall biosynthesis